MNFRVKTSLYFVILCDCVCVRVCKLSAIFHSHFHKDISDIKNTRVSLINGMEYQLDWNDVTV